ncbi:calmodulin-domain protein kinase 2, putative [Babesia bigemina]|uniref:Calmodulin-domain protein kinase 2, putative n=1 Tax=Babesia bigemina TaxID=5866 RepID=A0A061CZY5_BABBI|nr:calmodulin-domain protein kinase 2, putative [Babesia bigemina]CDR93978.1 calmodulin-domain protein kinase 2, putative [Babesia bigemina]|eukprot:XP_012766164.1 calmodulin-domain protein kinase 2, putative [Babesia bigemina]
MSSATTKRLLKYESPYRSSRLNCAANNPIAVMTAYAESTDSTPLVQCKPRNAFSHQNDDHIAYPDEESSAQLNAVFNRFSPVLKGGWVTYRRKYLEGPTIGKGSFGVVKALFPMSDILALQQLLPTRLQLPANRLSQGIRCVANNRYEFCGMPLNPPTRAVKIMNINNPDGPTNVKDTLHVFREVSIGAWLDHPNVVKVSEIYTNGSEDISDVANEVFHSKSFACNVPDDCTKVYLVMEFCSGGDLTSRQIPEITKDETVARMFVHVFRALSYINTLGIAHRDVKPENFLWSSAAPDADIKITDFGLANSPLHTLTSRAGTAYYVAPEIVRHAPQRQYSVQCDAWSAGIMLHVFLLGYCPFHAETDVKTLMRVANEEIDWCDARYTMITPDAFDLLRRLLVKDPQSRLSTTEALRHPWLRRATFEVSNIPMTVEEATGIVDALTAFYRCPILKQLALCVMVGQAQDKKVEECRKKYLYLSMFCENEYFWINSTTVEKWLLCTREGPGSVGQRQHGERRPMYMCAEYIPGYGQEQFEPEGYAQGPKRRVILRQSMLWKSVSRLNEILSNFTHHKISISFTEFLAAQLMPHLLHRSDLILDTFAGLRSETPGRRSIRIDARDLRRLLNPMYQCSNSDLEDVLRQTQLVANCTYLRNLETEEESKLRVYNLLKPVLEPKADSHPMNLTIDEFFVLMKSSHDIDIILEALSESREMPHVAYEAVKRRMIVSKLQEIEACCAERRKRKKVCKTPPQNYIGIDKGGKSSTPNRRVPARS